MSEEEKIRRAEEIAIRRQNRIPVSNINQKRRKKITTFDKLFLQVIASICIFGMVYFISQHNTYAMEKIKEAISNDTDFQSVYFEINNVAKSFLNSETQENDVQEEGQDEEPKEDEEQEEQEDTKEENVIEAPEETAQESGDEVAGVGGGNEGTEESISLDDVSYIKNNASFIKPVEGWITSPYGEREPTDIISANHAGVDIGANMGTDIVASMEGYVEEVSDYGDYGKHIKITNGEISTLYAHCSELLINQGDYVAQGQLIAKVGATGKATGPHLHFEIRRNNVTVDPQQILEL